MNQKIEKKPIRHEFTKEELLRLGEQLSAALSDYRAIDNEFTSIKSQYKSRMDTKKAEAALFGDKIQSKFEMREMSVFAVYRPKDGLKDYYAEGVDPKAKDAVVLLTEVMDPSDYQVELIQNKAQFENVVEIDLWPIAEESYGKLVLGRHEGQWYTALDLRVGGNSISERLDVEGHSYKQRKDAVAKGGKRAKEWLLRELGKETAKGFENAIRDAVDSQKEVVE